MRILMPFHNLVGIGTYWRTFGLAKELARRGHEITLLGAAKVNQVQIEATKKGDIYLVTVPSLWNKTQGSGYDLGDIAGRIRWTSRQDNPFDIVHAFESRPTTFLPAKILQRRGALYVSDWCDWFGRGGSVEERPNPLARMMLRPVETLFESRSRPGADGVTVINHTLYDKARSTGVASSLLLLLPNGAFIDDFRPQERSPVRERLGLPHNVPIIAYTGSLFQRDAQLMAAAFDRIQAAMPTVRLLLIGYTDVAVEEMVQIPQAIIRTGRVSFQDLVDYVAAATLGWIPLSNSPANAGRFPMKLSDFIASGRAVVVTDVGDLGNVVRQHNLGLVAKPTPVDLAQNVLTLLGDPVLRTLMERQAREAAETTFAWSHIVDKLEQFYLGLLANRSAGS